MADDAAQFAGRIDLSLLHPGATLTELAAACEQAKKYGFAAVIVHGWMTARAKALLVGSAVKTGVVVGFPLGSSSTTVKIVEAMEALKNGSEELDIVMNLGMLRSGNRDQAEIDVKNVVAMTKGLVHKIIIETGLLTPEEIAEASQIGVRAGAAFIKTSTGFGPRGATVEDVKAILKAVGPTCAVKASGGIRDLAAAQALIDAGAERIGTSSGAAIMEEYLKKK